MSDESVQSSSTSTTQNSTSTDEFSHEPYETFQHKVHQLACSLSKCQAHKVQLQRCRGGSFNRVVVAHLKRDNQTVSGIFRIPRSSNQNDGREIQDQAALLQFLASRDIPAPMLLAFDASAANPIGAPYVFQQFSTGTGLFRVYKDMSLQGKLSVADSLARFLICSEKIKFPRAGNLLAGKESSTAEKWTWFSNKEAPKLDLEVVQFDGEASNSSPAGQSSTPLSDFISTRLASLHQQELSFENTSVLPAMWQRLRDIHKEMYDLGFCAPQGKSCHSTTESILFHWDLEPRNILVKPKSSLPNDDSVEGEGQQWEIDKVIDWDRILAVPKVLARKPPVWLWDTPSDNVDNLSVLNASDGDVDILPPSRYDNDRLAPADRQIKQYFEDRFVEQLTEISPGYTKAAYLDEAYGNGRWIRLLARFAIEGVNDTQAMKRFDYFNIEWSQSRSRDVDEVAASR